jgi:hypothetical protein
MDGMDGGGVMCCGVGGIAGGEKCGVGGSGCDGG